MVPEMKQLFYHRDYSDSGPLLSVNEIIANLIYSAFLAFKINERKYFAGFFIEGGKN